MKNIGNPNNMSDTEAINILAKLICERCDWDKFHYDENERSVDFIMTQPKNQFTLEIHSDGIYFSQNDTRLNYENLGDLERKLCEAIQIIL
jgi:hypothetical protein